MERQTIDAGGIAYFRASRPSSDSRFGNRSGDCHGPDGVTAPRSEAPATCTCPGGAARLLQRSTKRRQQWRRAARASIPIRPSRPLTEMLVEDFTFSYQSGVAKQLVNAQVFVTAPGRFLEVRILLAVNRAQQHWTAEGDTNDQPEIDLFSRNDGADAAGRGGFLEYGDEDVLGTGSYGSDPKAGATLEGLAAGTNTFATLITGHGFPFTPEVSGRVWWDGSRSTSAAFKLGPVTATPVSPQRVNGPRRS